MHPRALVNGANPLGFELCWLLLLLSSISPGRAIPAYLVGPLSEQFLNGRLRQRVW